MDHNCIFPEKFVFSTRFLQREILEIKKTIIMPEESQGTFTRKIRIVPLFFNIPVFVGKRDKFSDTILYVIA